MKNFWKASRPSHYAGLSISDIEALSPEARIILDRKEREDAREILISRRLWAAAIGGAIVSLVFLSDGFAGPWWGWIVGFVVMGPFLALTLYALGAVALMLLGAIRPQ